MLAREGDGTLSGEQDVRRTLHHALRQIHRVRDSLHHSNAPG